jgi:hypothetical protein
MGRSNVQDCPAGAGRPEVLARASNMIVARAAFDTSVSLWPDAHIELRQGARVISNSNAD